MSLRRRLDSLEADLRRQQGDDLLGTLELHFTDAWPDCAVDPRHAFQRCSEHGEHCAVSISKTAAPGRVVILHGGPWLGI